MQIKHGSKPEGEVKTTEVSANAVRAAWLIEAAVAVLTSLVAVIVASVF